MKKLFTNNLIILAIFVVILAFFVPPLVQGKIPIPADAIVGLYHPWRDIELDGYNQQKYPVKNPLVTDPVLQTYPWRKIAIDNIKNLNIPLWNPYSFSGQPLAANIQSSVFQPLNILFFLMPFKSAWVMQIYLSTILAAVFTYLFLRSINLSKLASFFGAVTVPFGSFFTSWMTWGTINITASILPLALFCVNKLSIKLTTRYFLILTGSISWAVFSGHLQTASYIVFVTILYATAISKLRKSFKLLIICVFAVVLGLIISAVQLIPALEFSAHSNRSQDQAYNPQKEDWFIPPKHLVQIIAPDYFGNPAKGNYWGVWNYGEFTQFIGIVPLIFAIYAFSIRNQKTTFFGILLTSALFFALKNPVSDLPYRLNLPLISSTQPSRILYLLTFSLVILSAIGFDNYLKTKEKKKILLSFAIIAISYLSLLLVTIYAKNEFPSIHNLNTQIIALRNLIIPGIVGFSALLMLLVGTVKNYQKLAISILVLISISELFYFSSKFTPFSSKNSVYPSTKIINYLQNQPKPYRILSTDRRIANPNLLSAYQIESVSGYDPLYLKKYAIFTTAWQSNNPNNASIAFNRFVTPDNFKSQIINLLNVRYILTFDEIKNDDFEKVMEEGNTKLYRNKKVQERVFFVNEVTRTANEHEVLNSLISSSSLSRVAYSSTFAFTGGDQDAKAQILEYDDQSVTISTSSKSPTPLVVSNINYPGWKGYVDDEEVKIENVDYLFQSIVAPAGEHTIKLSYQPDIFKKSIFITFAGVMGAIAISFYLWKRSQ